MEVTDSGIKLPLLVCFFQLATLIPHKRQTRGVKKNNNNKKNNSRHTRTKPVAAKMLSDVTTGRKIYLHVCRHGGIEHGATWCK